MTPTLTTLHFYFVFILVFCPYVMFIAFIPPAQKNVAAARQCERLQKKWICCMIVL